MEYKIRLMKLGMKQSDLIKYMAASGYKGVLTREYLCRALSGDPGPRFDELRKAVDEALTKKEAEREQMEQGA